MNPEKFLQLIKHKLTQALPGPESHRLMTPGKRPLTRAEVPNIEKYRESAVAIICYPIDEVVHSIIIQRPEYEGTHGGQMSFPGGKMDPEDASIELAARREAKEEIGWILEEHHHLGTLTELFIPVSHFTVTPQLYYVENAQNFIPDAREVAEIISFPIERLLEDDVIKTTRLKLSTGIILKDVPYFDIQDKIVWGATAIILSELRELLHE